MKTTQTFKKLATAIVFLGLICPAFSQCPDRAYFYSSETELPWASCFVHQSGGSKTKIPFLPAHYEMAPSGTSGFTKDIALDLRLIFAGDGKVLAPDYNPYNNINASGKAVLICINFPDTLDRKKDEILTMDCVNEAIKQGAGAVVIADFSHPVNHRSQRFTKEYVNTEIPIIVIDKKGADKILHSAGMNPEELYNEWKSTGKFTSSELICNIKIDMKGKFNQLIKSNFTHYYPDGSFNPNDIEALSQENDRAVDFLLGLFKEMGLKWGKTRTVYFPGYDIKIFYTLHCGRGWATDKGIFMVLENTHPEYRLIVHENAHKLFSDNLGGNTSFISEGIGMYTQAEATNKMENHIITLNYLEQNKLFPLEQMMNFDIGSIPEETTIGYPASGSFIGFIIDIYGIERFKKLYMHKDITARWRDIYDKTLMDLESEWHKWLLAEVSVTDK